jgi:hypothetical protein
MLCYLKIFFKNRPPLLALANSRLIQKMQLCIDTNIKKEQTLSLLLQSESPA